MPSISSRLNVADDEAERYIRIFTDLDHETIEGLIAEHRQDPGRRACSVVSPRR